MAIFYDNGLKFPLILRQYVFSDESDALRGSLILIT